MQDEKQKLIAEQQAKEAKWDGVPAWKRAVLEKKEKGLPLVIFSFGYSNFLHHYDDQYLINCTENMPPVAAAPAEPKKQDGILRRTGDRAHVLGLPEPPIVVAAPPPPPTAPEPEPIVIVAPPQPVKQTPAKPKYSLFRRFNAIC